MQYNIELSELAEKQYDNILSYIANELKNEQALLAVMDDFDNCIEILSKDAGVFSYCKSERLKSMKLRQMHFKKHRYIFIYRIIENRAIIEGIYHELQDYENSI